MADYDQAFRIPDNMRDANFVYRWVLDDPKVMTVRKMQGYAAVKVGDQDGQVFKEDPRLQADGTIRVGDDVLMRCPKAKYEERERERRQKNTRKLAAIKEDYHEATAGPGISTFEDNRP